MFRPFRLSNAGSMFSFIAIAGSTARGRDPLLWPIVEPACDVSTSHHRRNELPTEWLCSGQNLFQQSVNERQCQNAQMLLSKSAVS